MSDRSNRLARMFAAMDREAAELLSGLTEAELRLPCEDSDVAHVAWHFAAGHQMVVSWLLAILNGQSPAAAVAAVRPADLDDPRGWEALLGDLERGAPVVVELLNDLAEQQLDLVPPRDPVADGRRSVEQILEHVERHGRAHLDSIRATRLRFSAPGRREP